jgi:hypothetical protein
MVYRILSAVSHQSYRMFARKYKIKLTKRINNKQVRRTPAELKKDIYNYEKKYKPANGMYF